MSIIQDALKKAQKQGTADQKPAMPSSVAAAKKPAVYQSYAYAQPVSRTPRKLTPLMIFLMVVIIAGGIAAALMMMRAMRSEESVVQPARKDIDSSRQDVSYKSAAATIATPAPKVEATKPPKLAPELVLNGIMYVEGNPRALVNNCIVSEGEMVSGAAVKKINQTNVVLDYNNTEITLRLKE